MGLTMIVGIVTEIAVFFFAEVTHVAKEDAHITEDVLVDAGLRRARPILMTSLVTILALLPLALRFGAGAEMQAPLAQAIIAGLVAAVPLVLFVLPVVTAIFARTPHATPTPSTPTTTNVVPTPISSPTSSTSPTSTTTNESGRSTR